MVLEKIKNKLKNGILISLSSLFLFFSCSKIQNPLGTNINYLIKKPENYKFTGDKIKASVTPLEKQFNEIQGAYQKPGENFSDYGKLSSIDGDYIQNLNTKTFGDYFFKFKIKSGETETKTESVKVPVYMNEQESDNKLDEILAPMLNLGSTNDFDVIDYGINFNQGRNGTLYNDDANITIYDSSVGGNQRDFVIDVQGDISDVYNQQKYDDAKAVNVSYKHYNPEKAQNLKKIIHDLKANGWPNTF